jgi:hypothetical protein
MSYPNWTRTNTNRIKICDANHYIIGQYERMRGIEPPSPTWKEGVIAIIRHPQLWTHLESNQAPNDYESFALTE